MKFNVTIEYVDSSGNDQVTTLTGINRNAVATISENWLTVEGGPDLRSFKVEAVAKCDHRWLAVRDWTTQTHILRCARCRESFRVEHAQFTALYEATK